MSAAQNLKSPLILGTSEGESGFLGIKEIVALTEIEKMKISAPVFLNFDHGKKIEMLKEAIDYNYDAVHFDGSDLPLKENINTAKELTKYAHKKGALLEGEMEFIGGESKLHKTALNGEEIKLTLPENALRFLEETKADSLAVSIGNVHGVYAPMPKLDLEQLKKIKSLVKSFLVLHGGSGINDQEIKAAIACGIVKINFNTEIRAVWRESLENYFKKEPEEIKPYKILTQVQNSIQKKVEEKIILLGSKNKV